VPKTLFHCGQIGDIVTVGGLEIDTQLAPTFLTLCVLLLLEPVVSALSVPEGPPADPFGQLRAAIAAAYDLVRQARRCLPALPPGADLPCDLQRAEADLVRALVAAERLAREAHEINGGERPVPITHRRSTLPRTA